MSGIGDRKPRRRWDDLTDSERNLVLWSAYDREARAVQGDATMTARLDARIRTAWGTDFKLTSEERAVLDAIINRYDAIYEPEMRLAQDKAWRAVRAFWMGFAEFGRAAAKRQQIVTDLNALHAERAALPSHEEEEARVLSKAVALLRFEKVAR